MRLDSGTGRGLSRTEVTIVKIAVFAPRHTARVSIAVAAYARAFHNNLKPNWTSRIMTHLWLYRTAIRAGGYHLFQIFLLQQYCYCHGDNHRYGEHELQNHSGHASQKRSPACSQCLPEVLAEIQFICHHRGERAQESSNDWSKRSKHHNQRTPNHDCSSKS